MAGDPAHPGGSTEGHPAAGAGPAPPQPQASSASKGLKGVSLRFLSDFAAKLPADMTTGQIVSKYITPKCQGQAFVDLVALKYIGDAQHYVIHAWSCNFLSDLVVPLLQHFIGDPTADASVRAQILATTFVWLDCFSSPQPPPADTTPRRTAVDAALSQCSSVVLLLDSTAAALSRTWCLYEASRALAIKGIECVHVPIFEFALDIVYEPLQALSYTSSESYSPMDKRELLTAVAEQYGQVAAQEEAGGGSRRSPRLSGALGAANRALIGGIQDALVGEAQQLIKAGVRSGPRYLACLRKAAEALRLGRAPLAEVLAVAAHKEHRKALGDSDAATLTSLCNLALLRKAQGRGQQAEELLRQVLAGRRAALGEAHPDTAASCDQLAWVLQEGGKMEEAAELYQQALDISRRVLGEEHPDTASSCNNLAGVLQALGRLDEAEPLLVKSLEVTRRTLGDRHPHTATNYNNLGVLYRARGDAAAARAHFQSAYDISTAALGHEHPDTATACANLGAAVAAEGRLQEAEALLRRGREETEMYLGSNHPGTKALVGALVAVLQEAGKAQEAAQLAERYGVPLQQSQSQPQEPGQPGQQQLPAAAAAAPEQQQQKQVEQQQEQEQEQQQEQEQEQGAPAGSVPAAQQDSSGPAAGEEAPARESSVLPGDSDGAQAAAPAGPSTAADGSGGVDGAAAAVSSRPSASATTAPPRPSSSNVAPRPSSSKAAAAAGADATAQRSSSVRRTNTEDPESFIQEDSESGAADVEAPIESVMRAVSASRPASSVVATRDRPPSAAVGAVVRRPFGSRPGSSTVAHTAAPAATAAAAAAAGGSSGSRPSSARPGSAAVHRQLVAGVAALGPPPDPRASQQPAAAPVPADPSAGAAALAAAVATVKSGAPRAVSPARGGASPAQPLFVFGGNHSPSSPSTLSPPRSLSAVVKLPSDAPNPFAPGPASPSSPFQHPLPSGRVGSSRLSSTTSCSSPRPEAARARSQSCRMGPGAISPGGSLAGKRTVEDMALGLPPATSAARTSPSPSRPTSSRDRLTVRRYSGSPSRSASARAAAGAPAAAAAGTAGPSAADTKFTDAPTALAVPGAAQAETVAQEGTATGRIKLTPELEAALVRIQAHQRGYMARKQVAAMKQQQQQPLANQPTTAADAHQPSLAQMPALLPTEDPQLPEDGGSLSRHPHPLAHDTSSPPPRPATAPPLPSQPLSGPNRRPPSRNAAISASRNALRSSFVDSAMYGSVPSSLLTTPVPRPDTAGTWHVPADLTTVPRGSLTRTASSHNTDALTSPVSRSMPFLSLHDYFRAPQAALRALTAHSPYDLYSPGSKRAAAHTHPHLTHTTSRPSTTNSFGTRPGSTAGSSILSAGTWDREVASPALPPAGGAGVSTAPGHDASSTHGPMDQMVGQHASMLNTALGQIRLMRARDLVTRAAAESRAMLQLKLQVIRTAVEQALTSSPDSTAVKPEALAAAAAAAVQRRPSNHHGMPRPPPGQEGRASPRDWAWGGGPSADGEVEREAEQELVGSPGQQHMQQHLQSVDVRDIQALMSEVGELRHLLTTTTSALSAAQRNVGQERDARQALATELADLQRRLALAVASKARDTPPSSTMTSARSSRSRPASGRPLSATARGPTPFASGAPGSPALTPAQPSGPLATTPAAFSSPVPTVAAHALPPGPSRSSPAGLGPAPAPQGAIALTRMPSGSRTGSAGSSGGASGRSALVARGQPSGAARAAGAPAAAAAARGPLVRGPSLGRTEPRPAGEVPLVRSISRPDSGSAAAVPPLRAAGEPLAGAPGSGSGGGAASAGPGTGLGAAGAGAGAGSSRGLRSVLSGGRSSERAVS